MDALIHITSRTRSARFTTVDRRNDPPTQGGALPPSEGSGGQGCAQETVRRQRSSPESAGERNNAA